MKRQLLHLIFVLLAILSAQAQDLNVCTYNVRYKNSGDNDAGNGWTTRRTYLINLVNFQQPDLLGVQEALNAQMNDLANGLTGYGRIGVGRDDGGTGGEFSAIFYRKERLVLLDNGDFWLSDTPYKPSKGFPSAGGSTTYKRICSWGKFYDKQAHVILYHFNTHLDLDETNRQQSYYLIRQKITEIVGSTKAPIIITGDYNAVQTGEAYRLFHDSGFLYDSYEKAKAKFITNGTCPGFNAGNYSTVSGELRRIDHIFYTKDAFTANLYAVLNPCYYSTSGTATYQERHYSDHCPVFTKLAYKTTVPTTEIATTPPTAVDGVYQISTPEELQSFANIVNGVGGFEQNGSAEAVLLNDIDMTEMAGWKPIGTVNTPFTGSFDGQGHCVTGFSLPYVSGSRMGLFGFVKNATIQNFSLSGDITCISGASGVGVVGWAEGSTISDVHSSLNIATTDTDIHHIAGVCGSLRTGSIARRCSFDGTLTETSDNTDCFGGIGGYSNENCLYENCANYGTLTFANADCYIGGICGYANNDIFTGIFNCLNVGKVQMSEGTPTYGGAFVGRLRAHAKSKFENNYMLAGSAPSTSGENMIAAETVSADQLASGEVCYKLNGDQTDINWYQYIGDDDYPVLDSRHGVVIFQDGIYTGITETAAASSLKNSGIYNLAGQRLSKMQKGINIINGKKVLK